jgi:hypothetical protein
MIGFWVCFPNKIHDTPLNTPPGDSDTLSFPEWHRSPNTEGPLGHLAEHQFPLYTDVLTHQLIEFQQIEIGQGGHMAQ